jgi:hypothetical protein
LLKGVAAVAEVARSEDVGLDAIANLLRRDDDGNAYAEDAFVVQLKSASTTTMAYSDHELDWLLAQSNPMFIGLVSLPESQIKLYPTMYINQAALSLHARSVDVHFEQSNVPPFLVGQERSPWRGESGNRASVWLGKPLLEWRIAEFSDTQWQDTAYSILKPFLAIARRELELLSFGQWSVITWSTNDPASISTQFGMLKGAPGGLAAAAERAVPALRALMAQSYAMEHPLARRVTAAVVALAAGLRDCGVKVDPHDLFGKVGVLHSKR